MNKAKQILAACMLTLLTALSYTPTVMAAQTNSTNYGASEVRFGTGGELHACSTTYCSKQSAGDLTDGNVVGPPATQNLNASGDTYVNSGAATTNYGTANPLNISSAATRALLKFNTSAYTNTALISSVTLRLYSTNAQGGAYKVHAESDAWTEGGVTWNNQPTWNSSILATSATATANTYVDIVLPNTAITTGGNTNLGVDYSAAGVSATFASREDATNPPKLVINYASGNYQAVAGSNTDRSPLLSVSVTGGVINLGDLDATATSSGSTTFSVKSYLASGYNVYIDGTSPKNKSNGHVLTPMATAAAAQPGIEQFGINLRQNSTPTVGANVAQVPDATFSFGTPTTSYNIADYFKYVAGDTIAQSTSSSGETDYTLSMIANIATTTDSGVYGGRLVLNVIPTF